MIWTVTKTKSLLKLMLGAVVVYVLFRWFEHHQVYFPSRRLDASGRELGRPFEEVHLTTSDSVRLHAWYFPADTSSPRKHLVILHCHGNAGNISHRLGLFEALLATGVNVFAFDYRGYGRSQGRPGEAGTYLDAQAACRWLRQKGFAPANIIVHGVSLGGGVATELALREPVGGLVLQSSFTSVPDIGAEFFPWLPARWLGTIRYDNRAKLPRIRIPILVMHSRDDRLVRFHHGEKILAAANEPKMFWELPGDHNETIERGRERYIEGLSKFLDTLGQDRGAAAGPLTKDFEMSYAILQQRLDIPEVEKLKRAFRAVKCLTELDAHTLANDAYGILVKNLSAKDAATLQGSLQSEGIETAILPVSSLPQLPPVKFVRRVDCVPEGLMVYDPLGRNFPVAWQHVMLVVAGSVRLIRQTRHETRQPVILSSSEVESPDFVTDVKYKETREFNLLLEIVLARAVLRYSINAEESVNQLFQYLGPRRTDSLAANLGLLLQDLAKFAPHAVLNRGAFHLRENSGKLFSYPSKNAFYEEITWLLWQLANAVG